MNSDLGRNSGMIFMLIDSDRRLEVLGVPILWLFSSPTINDAPRSVTNKSTTGHCIFSLNKVVLGRIATVTESSARHAKYIVAPRPNLRTLGDLALQERVPNSLQWLDVVVADAWIDPHFVDVTPDSLIDAPRFVEEERAIQRFGAVHSGDGDRIVEGCDFQIGSGGS